MDIETKKLTEAFTAGFNAGFDITKQGYNRECAYEHLAPDKIQLHCNAFDMEDANEYTELRDMALETYLNEVTER